MTDLRTALEEAYRKAEEPGEPEESEEPGQKVNDTAAAATAEGTAESVSGRNAEEGSGTGGPEAGAESPDTEGQAETPTVAAPVAWKGEAKQHWAELPSEVQREVLRREKDTNQVLRDTSEAREFHQKFQQAVEPYRALIASSGVDELQATQNLMRTAATLQVGNPHQKAEVVARIINAYGVDLATLGTFFGAREAGAEGEAQPGGNGGLDPRLTNYLDERLAPVTQLVSGLQQNMATRQQQTESSVDAEIDAFAADPDNIFFEDVRDDMSLLFDAASRQNRQLSMKEAYDIAVSMKPELQKIQNHRRAASDAKEAEGALQRKKMAAKSIQGIPQQQPTEAPEDLRSVLEANWNRLESGH